MSANGQYSACWTTCNWQLSDLTDCHPGSFGWQCPYSVKRLLICSTRHLLHPWYWGSGKKPGCDCYLKYQHLNNTQITIQFLSYQSCPNWWSEPWFVHSSIQRFLTRCLLWNLAFLDQFAFRPLAPRHLPSSLYFTLSPTNLLQSNLFVVVVSLDFSKAFNTFWHSTLLSELAELNLPTRLQLAGWWTSSAATHHTMFSWAPTALRFVMYFRFYGWCYVFIPWDVWVDAWSWHCAGTSGHGAAAHCWLGKQTCWGTPAGCSLSSSCTQMLLGPCARFAIFFLLVVSCAPGQSLLSMIALFLSWSSFVALWTCVIHCRFRCIGSSSNNICIQ